MYFAVSKEFKDEHLTFEVKGQKVHLYLDSTPIGELTRAEWIAISSKVDLFFNWEKQEELIEEDSIKKGKDSTGFFSSNSTYKSIIKRTK